MHSHAHAMLYAGIARRGVAGILVGVPVRPRWVRHRVVCEATECFLNIGAATTRHDLLQGKCRTIGRSMMSNKSCIHSQRKRASAGSEAAIGSPQAGGEQEGGRGKINSHCFRPRRQRAASAAGGEASSRTRARMATSGVHAMLSAAERMRRLQDRDSLLVRPGTK